MRTFHLDRVNDQTGVSGTGIVAEGVEFTDGTVAMTWLNPISSVTFYISMERVIEIHGHNGDTQVLYAGEEVSPPRSRAAA